MRARFPAFTLGLVLLIAATAAPAQQRGTSGATVPSDLSAGQPVGVSPAANSVAAVPTDALAFVTMNVGKMWDAPGFKPLRGWVETQKVGPLDAMFGMPLADVERVTLFVPAAARDAMPVVLVTTKRPYNEAKVLKALGAEADGGGRAERVGGAVSIAGGGPFAALVFGDERTVVYLPEPRSDLGLVALLGQVLAKKPDGPLAAALADATRHDVAVAVDTRQLAALGVLGGQQNELTPYLALLKARTVTFAADFDRTARGALKLTFADEASAKRAAPVLKEALSELAKGLADPTGPIKVEGDPALQALAAAVADVLKAAKVDAAGTAVLATAELPYADAVAKFAAALPKSLEARVNSARGANNLKQLALGFHNFESAMGFFPSDVIQIGGKSHAMSWRVQILPYLEQDNLYRQLDATKAWDDPVNLKKLEAMDMPKVFEIPGRPAPKGHTYFRVFSLPKNSKGFQHRPVFVEGQRGGSLVGITDGTSNTFLIVEAGEAVPWYKPDLLPYDGKLPLPQLGDKGADKFIVAFGDGSVRVLRPSKLGEKTLRALITAQGGEVVALP